MQESKSSVIPLCSPTQRRREDDPILERVEDWGTASSVFLSLGLVGTISPSADPAGILQCSFRESSLVSLVSGV